MNDDAERIRQQMQNVRQDLGAEVKDIVHGAKQLADWRYYVRKYPWACVSGAFALGFMAVPARKKLLNGDLQHVVEELKHHGFVPATAAASLLPGGIAGKILGVACPLLMKGAASLLATRLNAADAGASTPVPDAP